ncbi:MAG: hypothetical protein E7H42_10860, partial [Lactobacillus paragasseri]|nr:hypothetical protein [Lactobacillus paragasseri]
GCHCYSYICPKYLGWISSVVARKPCTYTSCSNSCMEYYQNSYYDSNERARSFYENGVGSNQASCYYRLGSY